jgi:hypothetical protein
MVTAGNVVRRIDRRMAVIERQQPTPTTTSFQRAHVPREQEIANIFLIGGSYGRTKSDTPVGRHRPSHLESAGHVGA